MKKWDLNDVLPPLESKEYKQLLQELEKDVKKLEATRSKLDSFTSKDLLEVLKTKERISETKNRLGAYAYLWFSENTNNSEASAFMAKMEDLGTEISNRTLFFNLWFKSLDEKRANSLMQGVPQYTYLLERVRETKPYSLNENEEKIINLKDLSGNNALTKIYDMFTASFKYNFEVDKKKKILTQEELRAYATHPDPALREAMYKELFRVYGENGQILGEMYRAIVGDWKNENLTLRKHKTPEAVRNIANDVPEEAYQALVKTVRKNTTFFQNYFELKFKACGIKDKSRYHLYAPYETKEKNTPYEDAVKIVLENFKKFSPEMAVLAENLIKKNHIDVEIRPGKKSGAYCYTFSPKIVPYVMLNYSGKSRDVFTLAHELGHAVHGQLSSKQSILMAHAPIPLAETASIFSEMMLFDKMLESEKDDEVKKGMLIKKLDDLYATIGRQTYLTVFEENAHRMIGDGAGVNDLTKEYKKELKEQFGSIKVPEEFQWEWTYIPHIYHTPFYCYGYSFGNLLTLALYERYKEEGKSFIPSYLKILSYGGSQRPTKILKEVDIDITSEKFWQSGFEIIEELVKDLKKLK